MNHFIISRKKIDVELLPMLQTLGGVYSHLEILRDRMTVAEKQVNLLELLSNEKELKVLNFTAEKVINLVLFYEWKKHANMRAKGLQQAFVSRLKVNGAFKKKYLF